jgi:hypothetical protein
VSAQLERIEAMIDSSGAATQTEALLPVGVRPRQLSARTLLIGMALTMLEGREAFLRNVHRTLRALPEDDQCRLGVTREWKHGPHPLTYRQLEYTFRLIASALAKDEPDGAPSPQLSEVLDRLLEASFTALGEPGSSSYAVDWTGHETWARPPRKHRARERGEDEPAAAGSRCTDQPAKGESDGDPQPAERPSADPEAWWGRRTTNHPADNETFFGYYLQAITTVKDERGPEVPELARRMHLASCDHDPPAALVPVIARMRQAGIPISDLLADSGYSYRKAQSWALALRRLGIELVQDLHPADRGPKGTHMGATAHNGQLYCPATPKRLLELAPLHRGATPEQTHSHDQQCAELARYKLSPITGHDPDGYRRVGCPAAHGKLRCPLREASMTLSHEHPTITTPPEHPPVCCHQQTITVPPSINAKTAQKHDYPSPQHRASYARRTAAERTFATTTDRATNDLSRGWCRLIGLTPNALFTATALIARNIRTADAFNARQAANAHRAANGLPPKRRKRRRQTTQDLINTANAPP